MLKKFILEHPICFTIIVCCIMIGLLLMYMIDSKQTAEVIQIMFVMNLLALVIKSVF